MTGIAAFGIGSSRFRYALGTPDGEFLTDIEIEPTDPERLDVQVVRAVEVLRRETDRRIDAVCVACAGLIDQERGVVEEIDTPEGGVVEDIGIAEAVDGAFGLPTHLENDCNAAVIGERAFGAGDGYECLVHVTIGTGIGAGVVDAGRLLRGEHGQAAEVGLLPVGPPERDSFGVPGAWEACCSGRGIPGFVRTLLDDEPRETALRDVDPLTAEAVFDAANDGDAVAVDCVDRIARYNAAGLGAIANAYNPGLITLGGGVVLNNPDWILGGIQEYLDDYCFVERPEVELTPLGGDVGLYGVLALPAVRERGLLEAHGSSR